MKIIPLLIATPMLISGCASSLLTYDSNKVETVGIPISTPVLVKITEKTDYEVVPGKDSKYCTSETNSKYQFMALGERSYIGFKPAQLGKGEFKVEFNDNGTLKSVSLNSDATAGTEKVTGLLETVLPFIAAPKPIPAAQASDKSAQSLKDLNCIKKGTQVTDVQTVQVKPAT